MRRTTPFLATALSVLVALPAQGQYYRNRPWTGHVMFGTSIPMGGTDDALGGSFSWAFGAMYSPPDAAWGIRFDVANNRFNIDNKEIIDAFMAQDGYARTWELGLTGEIGTPKNRPIRAYGLLGGAAMNRYAAVTEPTIVGGCWWDPWWGYICGSGPADAIIADTDDWVFGAKIGGGLSYQIQRGPSLFVEAVYTVGFSSSERPAGAPGGSGDPVNTTFVPLYFGIRF